MKRTKAAGAGKGPGKGSTYVSTTSPLEVAAELRRLAQASSLTRTAMARECITDAVARGLTVTKHKSHAGKVIAYPSHHPAKPTARGADGAAT